MHGWMRTQLSINNFHVDFLSLLLLQVVFIRDGSIGRLIIDGLTLLQDRVQEGNISWNVTSPFYVGGVPPDRAQKNIQVWI